MKFRHYQIVEIHSLGAPYDKERFLGSIAGPAVDWGDTGPLSGATLWIVHSPELGKASGSPYTHFTIPQSCLREYDPRPPIY
jgi:hypothetical protein